MPLCDQSRSGQAQRQPSRLAPLQVLAHEAVASLQQAVQDCQDQYSHFSSGLLRFEVRCHPGAPLHACCHHPHPAGPHGWQSRVTRHILLTQHGQAGGRRVAPASYHKGWFRDGANAPSMGVQGTPLPAGAPSIWPGSPALAARPAPRRRRAAATCLLLSTPVLRPGHPRRQRGRGSKCWDWGCGRWATPSWLVDCEGLKDRS